MEMIHALTRSEPKLVHTIELEGKSFVLECDIEALERGIECLRTRYEVARYGYQGYSGNHETNITEEEYQENIDEFLVEFHKRLEYAYVEKIVQDVKKKKNGTFHKGRVWDEYVLENAANNGSGAQNIYKVKYEVVEDLIIRLVLHYTSEYIQY